MPGEPDTGPEKRGPRSGISPETLIIAAAASVAASFLIARIWGPGTLFGAAAAPVIVALVSAGLQRPVGAVRRTTATEAADADGSAGSPPQLQHPFRPSVFDGLMRRRVGRPGAPHTPERGRWRWGVITGLAGFLIAVAIITVPDLLTGSSITGNGAPTTFFGASPKTHVLAPTSTPSTTTIPASVTTVARTVTATTSVTVTSATVTTTTVPPAPTTTTTSTTTPTSTTLPTATFTSPAATVAPTTAPQTTTPAT